ncbi:hypothetical protein TNCT_479841 [Trichonephila clavata]|uniref:DUF7041 domain-containing protein n=1 Tax=Trichonephila clavata TaxID=2740835 RepID=A0A8X6F4E2_TRICU|nr:hypothetical protein TNCT_479841 [Trichonephila clavata]
MEDTSTATLTDEERCSKLSGLKTQIQIFDVRKDYVLRMIEIDKKNLAPLPETMSQLESELKNLEDKINFLEDIQNLMDGNNEMAVANSNEQKFEANKVSVEIPPFWEEKPEIWFFQVEAQFSIANINQEENKFNYLVAQ